MSKSHLLRFHLPGKNMSCLVKFLIPSPTPYHCLENPDICGYYVIFKNDLFHNLFCFIFCMNLQYFRDHQQITFVTFNRFCQLSNSPLPYLLKNATCSKKAVSFCIVPRYQFSQLFTIWFSISRQKNIFVLNFPFLTDSLKPPNS